MGKLANEIRLHWTTRALIASLFYAYLQTVTSKKSVAHWGTQLAGRIASCKWKLANKLVINMKWTKSPNAVLFSNFALIPIYTSKEIGCRNRLNSGKGVSLPSPSPTFVLKESLLTTWPKGCGSVSSFLSIYLFPLANWGTQWLWSVLSFFLFLFTRVTSTINSISV